MSEERFSDFLKYHIEKYGEKDLSIKKWKSVLKIGNKYPIIDMEHPNGFNTQRIMIYENGTLGYDFFPPKYVRAYLEKSIKNMYRYFQTEYQVFKYLRKEYNW